MDTDTIKWQMSSLRWVAWRTNTCHKSGNWTSTWRRKNCNNIVYSHYLFHRKFLNMHMCAHTYQNSIHPVWYPLPIPIQVNISFMMRTAITSTYMAHCVMVNDIMTLAFSVFCIHGQNCAHQVNLTSHLYATLKLLCTSFVVNSIMWILGFHWQAPVQPVICMTSGIQLWVDNAHMISYFQEFQV